MAVLRFDQLLPGPGAVQIGELLAGLGLHDHAPADRPYVIANFVSRADGRATFLGGSGRLGDEGDLEVFRALRREADAVLVGTGTLRVERYGRILKVPVSRERRRRRGLAPEPLATTLTRSGDVPLDIPLFAEPEAEVLLFSGREIDVSGVAAQVQVVVLDPPDLASALAHLSAHHQVKLVLCEGGPAILAALVRERLLDELFLTLAPQLTGGGSGPSLTSGPELPELRTMELAGVLERAGSLFLRYRLRS